MQKFPVAPDRKFERQCPEKEPSEIQPHFSLHCSTERTFFHVAAIAQPALEYIDYISAEQLDTPSTTSVLDMTLKQYNGEVPVMLELWGMQSTPSLSLLLSPLWLEVVAHDRCIKTK